MATASDVARYIVKFFQDRGELITNLKVQKLLYYVQGWHLALYQRPAFADDFQAWVHGPVVYSVYSEYRDYQWRPILDASRGAALGAQLKEVVDEVLAEYGTESAWMLERRTHSEMPWQRARGNIAPDASCIRVIDKAWIAEYFTELANATEGQEA